MHRYAPLQLARPFETAHDLLTQARWLVRIFGMVVQPFLLAAPKLQSHSLVFCRIAFEHVGNQCSKRYAILSEQFAHEPLGGTPVTSAFFLETVWRPSEKTEAPYCFIGHLDTASRQHFFNYSEAHLVESENIARPFSL